MHLDIMAADVLHDRKSLLDLERDLLIRRLDQQEGDTLPLIEDVATW